jgi:hypothetical protein
MEEKEMVTKKGRVKSLNICLHPRGEAQRFFLVHARHLDFFYQDGGDVGKRNSGSPPGVKGGAGVA